MEHLWAPWRGEYISSGAKTAGCVFCVAMESKDKLLLHSGALSMVVMNKYPYNNGHLMVSPVRHIARVEELTVEEGSDIMRLVSRCSAVLRGLFNPDGFNIGMNVGKAAGAGVEGHLHMHIVPRWNGDTNFMTTLAEARVVSEHLMSTREKLLPHFAGL